MGLIQPQTQIAYWVIPSLELDGATPVGQATGINNDLSAISADGEAAFLSATRNIGSYKPLPDSGWLESGQIYGYNSGLVIVRQSHDRTLFAPEQTPNLFSVYRGAGGGVLDWITNEPVLVGTHRVYGAIEYVCLQAHTTQVDWTPSTTPTLWQVYAPTQVWAYPVAYKVDDVVIYRPNGYSYKCRQAHTSQVDWKPPDVPALWLKL